MKILIAEKPSEVPNYIEAFRHIGDASLFFMEMLPKDPVDIRGFDALLLPGGDDIDPALFGQEWNGTRDVNRALDDVQIALTQDFAKAGKPVLGICRGCQVINVALGGDLIQDLPEPMNSRHTWYHDENGKTAGHVHGTRIQPGTFLADLYGTSCVTNSYHHQALGKVAPDLAVIQESDDDVIEFAVHKTLPIYAVQWHPEKTAFGKDPSEAVDGGKLFLYFADVVRKNMQA